MYRPSIEPTVLARGHNNLSFERLFTHFEIPWPFRTMLKQTRLPPACRICERSIIKPKAIVDETLAILDQYHARCSAIPWVDNVEVDSGVDTDLFVWHQFQRPESHRTFRLTRRNIDCRRQVPQELLLPRKHQITRSELISAN